MPAVLEDLQDHLDLEPVPLGPHLVEVDPAQGLGPVGPEARRRVRDVQAQQQCGVDVATLRQKAAVPAPVGDLAPVHVARPHHEIDALRERCHEAGQGLGLVGQIGVHLHEGLPAAFESPRETGAVRAPEARLGPSAHDLDATQLGAQGLGHAGRAVGAPVVDHQHPGLGQRGPDAAQDVVDVLRLVVGGQHDQDAARRAA